MEPEMQSKIEATVLEVLKSSDMEQMTEFKVRKVASEMLGIDLSLPQYKKLVRNTVESFLLSRKEAEETKDADGGREGDEDEEDEEEEEEEKSKNGREVDDEGNVIVCRLSKKRRVMVQDFRGKMLVSIREYYDKGGKELPSSKGISLTTDQWAEFKKSVPDIEAAIEKLSEY